MNKEEIARWEQLIKRPIINPNEFFMGSRDCIEYGFSGFRQGFGADYERGFWAQYQSDELRINQ